MRLPRPCWRGCSPQWLSLWLLTASLSVKPIPGKPLLGCISAITANCCSDFGAIAVLTAIPVLTAIAKPIILIFDSCAVLPSCSDQLDDGQSIASFRLPDLCLRSALSSHVVTTCLKFAFEWPDGTQATCYSPSLVVKDYFSPNQEYPLADFVSRSRTALQIASDRVQAKYGYPCGLALGQLQEIEASAQRYDQLPQPRVRVIRFIE
jgi:uncharacterized repeat protein (TIGR04042 family)